MVSQCNGKHINGNLDLTGSASTEGRISANYLDVPNISPVGSIMIFQVQLIWPTTNWRECNGAGLSTSAYPELFAVIGYTYGQGQMELNLASNLKGKFVTGVGADDWNNTLNETGGRSDAILPKHDHDITDPGHAHDFNSCITRWSS